MESNKRGDAEDKGHRFKKTLQGSLIESNFGSCCNDPFGIPP